MARIHGFPPIESARAEILILGSMPSRASLAAGQYYAHRQNAFWRIMAELFGFAPDAPYPLRKQALQTAGIALWDVLHACERHGSLDANIIAASQVTNDFGTFFQTHPAIRHVYFNGSKAESAFKQLVLPAIPCPASMTRLPSTSPANASMTFHRKLAAWRTIADAR
ncbi:MAG: DNA-deoxyinosine glycosylase [Nitrosomonas halophila]